MSAPRRICDCRHSRHAHGPDGAGYCRENGCRCDHWQMRAELALSEPLTDAVLVEAVAIMRDRHFPALALANALAGARTPVWRAIHEHGPALLKEAARRGLSA